MADSGSSASRARRWPDWHSQLAPFCISNNLRAAGQLLTTLVPYLGLFALALAAVAAGWSWLLIAPLQLLAAALLVRVFILFHDCVHGSFFRTRRANQICGYLLGLLVFTSFEDWQFTHLRHHGTYANLDARGFGDIWTMTLAEYRTGSRWLRLGYRLYRSPLVLFGLGALFTFLLHNRLPDRRGRRREWMSVLLTNLLLVLVAMALAGLVGWSTYLVVQLPILVLAGAMGIWLFYVQHQFPGGYWARQSDWDPLRAAMEGSSFYRLPPILDWLSGHIGYHHIHHLNPRIPNYLLRPCYAAVEPLRQKRPLTLAESLGTVRVKLWDEDAGQMVDFSGRAVPTGGRC